MHSDANRMQLDTTAAPAREILVRRLEELKDKTSPTRFPNDFT
jgi:hypothetical protein